MKAQINFLFILLLTIPFRASANVKVEEDCGKIPKIKSMPSLMCREYDLLILPGSNIKKAKEACRAYYEAVAHGIETACEFRNQIRATDGQREAANARFAQMDRIEGGKFVKGTAPEGQQALFQAQNQLYGAKVQLLNLARSQTMWKNGFEPRHRDHGGL
jgi:hypothetical protein